MPFVFSFVRISSIEKSKFDLFVAPRSFARCSGVMYPLWSSSRSKKAFLTDTKLFESLFYNSASSFLTCSAALVDFKDPEKIEVPADVVTSSPLPFFVGESTLPLLF